MFCMVENIFRISREKKIIIYTAFVMETGGGIWPDMAFASKFVQIWNFSAKYYSVMQGMSL